MFARSNLTAAELTPLNPVIPINEFWLEKDTGFVKRGSGAAWTSTDYWRPDGGQQLNLSGFGPTVQGTAGEYWSYPGAHGTQAGTDGGLYTVPVYVPRDIVIDRIGAEVTTGVASTTITLGVYEDSGAGVAGALLFDAGTIDGASATAQEITISRKLKGGRTYWLAALVAGGTPTFRSLTSSGWAGRQATLAAATGATQVRVGRVQGGVVGTPLPATAGTSAATIPPVIAIRLA